MIRKQHGGANGDQDDAERERWRYRIAKHWRANRKMTWTDAEMEAAIDKMIERDRIASAPAPKPAPGNASTVQTTLFGADEAANATRAEAAQNAKLRSSRAEKVIACVKRAGDFGRTNDELSIELNIAPQSIPSLTGELVKAGTLIRTKRRRLTRLNAPAAVLIYNRNAGGVKQ